MAIDQRRADKRPGRRRRTTACSATSTHSGPTRSGSPTSPSTRTAEGKVYCCAIEDPFRTRIVGYTLGARLTAQLVVAGLRTTVARREPTGVLVASGSSLKPQVCVGAWRSKAQRLQQREWRPRCPTRSPSGLAGSSADLLGGRLVELWAVGLR